MSYKKKVVEGETFDGECEFKVFIIDYLILHPNCDIMFKTQLTIELLNMKSKKYYWYSGWLRNVFKNIGSDCDADKILNLIKNELQSDKCQIIPNYNLTMTTIDCIIEYDNIIHELSFNLKEDNVNNVHIEKFNKYEKDNDELKNDCNKLKNDYDNNGKKIKTMIE